MKGSGITIMVRELHEMQGKSISEIARELGMSRATVRKYLKQGHVPDKRIGSKRGSKLDPYKPFIQELMEMGIYNSVVILDRIQEKGFDGKLSILKEYLHPLRPVQVTEGAAVRRYESKPGCQVQMDWGICNYLDTRKRKRKVACFVMILGHSRTRYIEFCQCCDLANLLRCIVNAFVYFGGVPETLLTDHMKTVVNHSDPHETVWQEGFEHFASELGFVPKLCRVRRPQTKGKVERLVHFVKNNFMPGREFTHTADLNRQARAWCDKVNSQVHETTGEKPFDLLLEEKLKPLPGDGRHLAYRWMDRKASSDGFVSYDGIKYGVNWRYSRQLLKVALLDGKIMITTRDGELIQEHPQWERGRKYMLAKGQYDGLFEMEGQPKAKAYGYQISEVQVAVRDLRDYAQYAGGF